VIPMNPATMLNGADKCLLGLYPADILLPRNCDMKKWAVVACDQFTSQPEYWQEVEKTVGKAPSTLRLMLPEVELHENCEDCFIRNINRSMEQYLQRGLFETLPGSMIYLERTQSDGRIRHGLVAAIDLEAYDYTPGSNSLIRATEETVLERIPPRIRVRQEAPIELPHVMLLVDDPKGTCIEPLTAGKELMEQLYDFDLMMNGGHLTGWKISEGQVEGIYDALRALRTPEAIAEKYGLGGIDPLLFAVGDGNHSLATAKACYEEAKKGTPREKWDTLPARYALVEIVNLHDEAISFKAIHRVLFGVEPDMFMREFKAAYPNAHEGRGEGHVIEVIFQGYEGYLTVPDPKMQLAVGTLQSFLDEYIARHGGEVDYIHGGDVTKELGRKEGNMGFILPRLEKEQLFKTVMADGVLPRKTFSMGSANDKRYYVEARKIK